MNNYFNCINIIFCAIQNNRWQPNIGDPTFMGWFTVFAYLLVAFLCLLCAFKNRQLRIKKR